MNNKPTRFIAMIVVFLAVAVVFFTESQTSLAEFLIFLFSGILIGINIMKLKNKEK